MPNTTKKKYSSDLLNILNERGFIHQTTDDRSIDDYFNSNEIIGYIGFDLTAKSLHVGSLLQIMLLKWLQDFGHKPIVLLGGGTTLIGDPSGKDESRKILDIKNIANNHNGILKVFKKFLNFDTEKLIIENNSNWLTDLNYITFLRDFGKHFTVNRMLSFDSVKLRLDREQPLSFLEFNYMLFQAYDFWELNRRHNCKLQLGGSDQWGNIINGIELIRRVDQTEAFAINTPLITTSSGSKMGKTSDGAIWLDEDLTNPHEFWQFWRNTDDRDVNRFLKLFTTLPLGEIQKLEELQGSELNEAKKILANEVTKNTHGGDIADLVYKSALETYEKKIISENLPLYHLNRNDFVDNIGLLTLLVKVGFSKSNSDARKSILNGAIKINDQTIIDPKAELAVTEINKLKLSFGKKKHLLLSLDS